MATRRKRVGGMRGIWLTLWLGAGATCAMTVGCRSNLAGLAPRDAAIAGARADGNGPPPTDPDGIAPGMDRDGGPVIPSGPTMLPVPGGPDAMPPPGSAPPVTAPPAPALPDAAAGDTLAGATPGPAPSAPCSVGQVVCLGRMPQICGADGKWVTGEACPYACQGGCVNKFSAVSAGRGAPTDEEGVTEFARNAVTFFAKKGGLLGARGFNVVVLDPGTGATIEPVKNFDPWVSPISGNALKELVAYLDALEPNRLVMIATCDDPGIAKIDSCEKLDSKPVTELVATLQRLGSTQIADLCFRGAWSFAAITGQGKALAEKVSPGPKIAAEFVLPAQP
jgi:hypothetical protein